MIEFQTASKTYGQTEMLHGLTLAVEAGETVVLIGPSGGGKTTALKLVNGLVQPTSGTVLVDGRSVDSWDLLALRRSIGYVIQEVGLFPHWTVAANVGLLPRLLGWGAGEIDRRVNELLELVALDPGEFRQRYPRELSGGQTQRVGVARALALKPGILLMDEPFGALDPLLRAQLQQELLRILAEVHTTTLLVTHDLPEAFRMADRIGVLVDGQLQQVDTPAELRRAPQSEFIRRLMTAELMEGGSP